MHGEKDGAALMGSTPADKLAIGTAERLVGVLLIDIGLILGLVANVKDEKFQKEFCGVAIATHMLMGGWRIGVASKVPALEHMWKKQLAGDVLMASTWAYFLARNAK